MISDDFVNAFVLNELINCHHIESVVVCVFAKRLTHLNATFLNTFKTAAVKLSDE